MLRSSVQPGVQTWTVDLHGQVRRNAVARRAAATDRHERHLISNLQAHLVPMKTIKKQRRVNWTYNSTSCICKKRRRSAPKDVGHVVEHCGVPCMRVRKSCPEARLRQDRHLPRAPRQVPVGEGARAAVLTDSVLRPEVALAEAVPKREGTQRRASDLPVELRQEKNNKLVPLPRRPVSHSDGGEQLDEHLPHTVGAHLVVEADPELLPLDVTTLWPHTHSP